MMAMTFAQPTERSQTQSPPEAVVFANSTPQSTPRVFARSPFGGFKLEHESAILTPQHKRNSRLEQITEAWQQLWPGWPHVLFDKEYSSTLHAVSGINCTTCDLAEFMLVLPELLRREPHHSKIGFFLSALINTGSSRSYLVRTSHLECEIPFIGMENKEKHITVEGNVGELAGYQMKGGSLIIQGNATCWPGTRMRGGVLYITGDVGTQTGPELAGGTIIVGGNAGDFVGDAMTGGAISILGQCHHPSKNISGGKVSVGGRQVFPVLTVSGLVQEVV